MAEWLSEEREVELIDMWQARPVLYKVISKEHSIIEIKECWSCSRIICGFAYDLPFCIFSLPPASLTPRHVFFSLFFFKHAPDTNIILLLSVTI